MKLVKNKSCPGSTKWLTSDDKKQTYCIIGIVEDLKKMGILEECNAPNQYWAYVCEDGYAEFYPYRETVIKYAVKEAPLHLRENKNDETTY